MQTHTMEGVTLGSGSGSAVSPPPELPAEAGIIPRTFRHIFAAIGASADQTFLVRASMLEIYQEEVRDLLAKVSGRAFHGCCTRWGVGRMSGGPRVAALGPRLAGAVAGNAALFLSYNLGRTTQHGWSCMRPRMAACMSRA